ncbi:hypothetical protein M9H77_14617 [Catharanthus roseus]|uniref:Uncharacterized protein n=1 Tax=Catharanthus roseus TaxID=4058 RepID=A0ACC0BNQ6_CATRO|nr:hypothetical protein M9H77_14617 [Catharanthus roseus]
MKLRGNDHTYWRTQYDSHIEAWYQWRFCVRDGPALAAEVLSYPSDEYIRWYWGIKWVYSNPVNRDTSSHGYQPAGVDRRMMVDDIDSVVIQEPPTDPSQMAVFAKKVQTIIRRCMVSVGGTLGYTLSQHDIQQMFHYVLDRGARGVKRGARRQPSRGAGGGRPPVLPFPDKHEHADPGHVEVERGEGSGGEQPTIDPFDNPNLDIPFFSLGLTQPSQSLPSGSRTLQMPPPPVLGFAPFLSPQSTTFGFFGFRAPPPPDTAGSSTRHQPIS